MFTVSVTAREDHGDTADDALLDPSSDFVFSNKALHKGVRVEC